MRRLGLTHTQERKPWKSFRANAKNEMWQSDMLGPFSTPIGEISMLVVLDDWSLYAMSRSLHGRGKTKEATAFLDESIIKQTRKHPNQPRPTIPQDIRQMVQEKEQAHQTLK